MPKRPSSRGSGDRRKADDPILAEHQRILAAQEELLRKQEEARRVIENAPRRLEQLKKRQREPIVINLKASRAGQKTFGLPRDKFRETDTASPGPRRARKSDRNIAKLQFIVLCVILFVIVLMLWRVVPQH
jgi:hypothetical protein